MILAYLAKQTIGTAIGLGFHSVMLQLTGAVLAAVNYLC